MLTRKICLWCQFVRFDQEDVRRPSRVADTPCLYSQARMLWIIFAVTRCHFNHDVTSCSRKVAAYWSAGRARFDKRISAAAVQDEARRHETMIEFGPEWAGSGHLGPLAWHKTLLLDCGSGFHLDPELWVRQAASCHERFLDKKCAPYRGLGTVSNRFKVKTVSLIS